MQFRRGLWERAPNECGIRHEKRSQCCEQGLLPAAYTRDNGMMDATDFGEEGPPLTIGEESVLFYESLLKMWILTGREATPYPLRIP